MKSFTSLMLLLPFLGAFAAPTPSEMGVGRDVSWPETVALMTRHGARSVGQGELNNQERFKRGLGPAKPERLYSEERNLAKRLDPAPSAALGINVLFGFQSCSVGTLTYRAFVTITATSSEDAANQCAAQAQNGESYLVGHGDLPAANAYYCIFAPLNLPAPEACNGANYALYISI